MAAAFAAATLGMPRAPAPVKAMVCGLLLPLFGMFSVADRLPTAAGVKVMASAQLAPPASVVPLAAHWARHLQVSPKQIRCCRSR